MGSPLTRPTVVPDPLLPEVSPPLDVLLCPLAELSPPLPPEDPFSLLELPLLPEELSPPLPPEDPLLPLLPPSEPPEFALPPHADRPAESAQSTTIPPKQCISRMAVE